MTPDEKFARMQHLYVYVCTMALGNYSQEAEECVAEYFELRAELEGY